MTCTPGSKARRSRLRRLGLRRTIRMRTSGPSRRLLHSRHLLSQMGIMSHHRGARMAEQLLHLHQRHAGDEPVRRERMAIAVRGHSLQEGEFGPQVTETAADGIARPGLPTAVAEERTFWVK